MLAPVRTLDDEAIAISRNQLAILKVVDLRPSRCSKPGFSEKPGFFAEIKAVRRNDTMSSVAGVGVECANRQVMQTGEPNAFHVATTDH
jgi:hypothetical protein